MTLRPRSNLRSLLALLTLVASTAAPRVRADAPPPRLDLTAVPTEQSVDLTCDPEKPDYSGSVTIALDVKQPTQELRFHARALTIDEAELKSASATSKPTAIEKLAPDQARLRFAAPLAAGHYTLTMKFHNAYNTRAISLYKVVTGGHSYLFTQLEDTEAREAFPCWDEPSFKIPWHMTLRVPAADLAVSNTPVASEKRDGDMKAVVFEATKPLPSYLIAIAVGPFETVPIPGMGVPGRVITVQGASRMAGDAARAAGPLLKSLERYFGRPYPYAKLDLIAAPEFLYGAMENAGAIVFADRALLLDPATTSPSLRNRVFGTMAHEMAHMWFGDLVTMKWWDDLWLNESFATWMGTRTMDDVFPDDREGVGQMFSEQRAFTTDSRPSTRAMRGKIVGNTSLGETANELTYNKGCAVLTMFEGWVGPEKFRAGVLDYLKAHEWSNAEGRDLWLTIGKQSGEDIDAAMASFLDQAGVPLVTLEPAGGGKVKLSQRRFLTVGGESGDPTRWRVPVILRYPANGALQTKRVWLSGADTVTDLGVPQMPAWIMPNAGGSGYYRWRVPDAMREALIAAARSQLSERERIDVISNLTAQMRAGAEPGDQYLQMVATMADDPEPEVLRADMESLDENRIPLSTPRSAPALQAYVRTTFDPALHRLGMTPRAGELPGAAESRGMLLRLLGDAGQSAPVLAFAESLGAVYRRSPASVPPSLVDAVMVLAARRGDRTKFDDYRKHFESATVPSDRGLYLAGLGCFRDPALRAAALDYCLHGPLRPQEAQVIPASMSETGLLLANARGNGGEFPDDVMQWTLDHWDALAAKMPPNFASRNLRLTSGCSKERLATVEQFFSDPKHDQVGVQATLHRLADAMEECAGLHDREAERVEKWLGAAAGSP
jgi:alanyl aminopeptidase